MNIQCPSLEQINTNSGKVNISARYLFELCLCPGLLYIEFSDQYVEERLNRLLPGVYGDGIRYLANGTVHSSGEDSLIPATAAALAVTHDRYALLLCLFLVHYPAPAVAVVTGSTYGPFSMALLAEYPNLLPDRLHLLPV